MALCYKLFNLWSQNLVCIASCKSDVSFLLSPVLFIIFMDRISRCNQAVEGIRFSGLWILSLLFADDVVLLASSNSDLQLSLGRLQPSVKQPA